MHVASRLANRTKQHGTIVRWKEKGFGFIEPRDGDGGSDDIFFHASEFAQAQIIGKDVVFDTQFDETKGKPSAINVQDAELQKMQELKDALVAREQQSQELEEALNASKKELQQSNESHTKANEDGYKNIQVYRARQQADKVEKESMRQKIATLEQEALKNDAQASSCQKECKKLREELAASQRQCEEDTETMQQNLQALSKDNCAKLEKCHQRQLADENEKQTLRVQLEQEARKRKALDEECARSKRQHTDELQSLKKDSCAKLEKCNARHLADEDEKQTLRVQIRTQEARKKKALDEECARSKRRLTDELQSLKMEQGKLRDRIERRHAEEVQALTKENKKLRDCFEENQTQLLNLMKQKETQRTGNQEHQEEKKNTQQKPQAQRHRCDQDNKDSNHDNDKLREPRRCRSVRLEERKSQESPPHHSVHRRRKRRRTHGTEQYNETEADFGSPKS